MLTKTVYWTGFGVEQLQKKLAYFINSKSILLQRLIPARPWETASTVVICVSSHLSYLSQYAALIFLFLYFARYWSTQENSSTVLWTSVSTNKMGFTTEKVARKIIMQSSISQSSQVSSLKGKSSEFWKFA